MREELRQKQRAEIRGMFGRIAARYDLLNRLLSLGQDRRWRRVLEQRLYARRAGSVLDVCTGTADVALGFDPALDTIASDFCVPMLALARMKARNRGRSLPLVAADALQLPVTSAAVDAVTVAFGVRNFEDLEAGLGELRRVLRSGGALLVLEFSRPRGILGPAARWWVRHVPPIVGRWISGDLEAYAYLPDSVASFPEGPEMCALLEKLGFRDVTSTPLTGGVATLYEAQKPSKESSDEQ